MVPWPLFLTFQGESRILTADMETLSLAAKKRDANATRPKDVRAAGDIPAVLYGHGVDAQPIAIPATDFRKIYARAGSSALVDVVIDGGASVKAIIQEVQPDPLTMETIHVDFNQVRMDEKMTARVPLVFTGESDAVKTLGGTLMKTMDAVEVECLPGNLPHEIMVDLAVLKTFEDAITVVDLKLPNGVEVTNEDHLTIASVSAPLTEEQLKKMEESQVGDVAAVKTEAEEKKDEKEAEGDEKKDEEKKSE